MLYRMYTRWAERHGYQYEILNYLDGDEQALKVRRFLVNAYGYLAGSRHTPPCAHFSV